MKRHLHVLLAVCALGVAGRAPAQSTYEHYAFTTLAGHPVIVGSADGTGSAAQFRGPSGAAVDSAGNVYVADTFNNTIRKITPVGVVTTLAGSPASGGSADGTGSEARFYLPYGIAVDAAGTVYVAEWYNYTIRKITPGGVVTTLAGLAGNSGTNNGTGSAARFNQLHGLAVDSAGTLYVADLGNQTIRKITPAGVVTTLAGLAGSTGNTDGTGEAARFQNPDGVAVDTAGNVYVADGNNHAIRKITPAGDVTTLAGGTFGSNDGTGSAAQFYALNGIAVDGAGTVYVADNYYSLGGTLRQITPGGVVTTLAGFPGVFAADVDGAALDARFVSPTGLAVDNAGNLYVTDNINATIRKITSGGNVSTLAGSAGIGSVNGTGTAARFSNPSGVAVDHASNVYVADTFNHTLRKITPAGEVSTLAGLAGVLGTANGAGSAARFNSPYAVAVDQGGTVYVSDRGNGVIRKVTPAGLVTTFATGFDRAGCIALDGATNLYVAMPVYFMVLKITPNGVVSPFAGSGQPGSANGTAATAQFNGLYGVAADSAGIVYVADSGNHTIRKITPGGDVTTLAGLAGNPGSTDGTGSAARFYTPQSLAVDNGGNVYVADTLNYSIRKITAAGVVTTLGGDPSSGGNSDGIGARAQFNQPSGIAVDGRGKVYVADTGNHTIRTDVFTVSLASVPPDNDFGMYLAGWLGQQYRVDYKDTLSAATWTMLTTVTLSNGSGQVTDPQSRSLPGRYYRIVLLQ